MTKRQIALDTETTGKCDDGTPGTHKIIEIGCVEIIDRKPTGRELQFFINPHREIDKEATEVHGIRNEDLVDKPSFSDIANELKEFLYGAELLIHNAKFDTSFLDKEWEEANLNFKTKDICTITDTIAVARKINPNRQVSLKNLCKVYGIDDTKRTKHGALLDAQLLAEVYLAMTGGQETFSFDVNKEQKATSKWSRPQNIVLPKMKVEPEYKALHISNMIALSQGKKFIQKDDETYLSGSNWSSDFNMEYLEKGADEDKKEFKKRLSKQKDEMLQQLLSENELNALHDFEEKEKEANLLWDKKVRGEE